MSSCVKCGNDLPAMALHCVFCGARQDVGPPQAPPAADDDSKTVMQHGAPALPERLRAEQQAPTPQAAPMPEPVPGRAGVAPEPARRPAFLRHHRVGRLRGREPRAAPSAGLPGAGR